MFQFIADNSNFILQSLKTRLCLSFLLLEAFIQIFEVWTETLDLLI